MCKSWSICPRSQAVQRPWQRSRVLFPASWRQYSAFYLMAPTLWESCKAPLFKNGQLLFFPCPGSAQQMTDNNGRTLLPPVLHTQGCLF